MRINFSYVQAGFNEETGEPILFWKSLVEGDEVLARRYKLYICHTLPAVAQTDGDCARLLDFIVMAAGGEGEFETGGNDVTLTIKKSGVQVDIEVNDDWVGQEDGFFTLEEWRKVVVGWRDFIGMVPDLSASLTVDI